VPSRPFLHTGEFAESPQKPKHSKKWGSIGEDFTGRSKNPGWGGAENARGKGAALFVSETWSVRQRTGQSWKVELIQGKIKVKEAMERLRGISKNRQEERGISDI
jgi:hypothetical protein